MPINSFLSGARSISDLFVLLSFFEIQLKSQNVRMKGKKFHLQAEMLSFSFLLNLMLLNLPHLWKRLPLPYR